MIPTSLILTNSCIEYPKNKKSKTEKTVFTPSRVLYLFVRSYVAVSKVKFDENLHIVLSQKIEFIYIKKKILSFPFLSPPAKAN